MEPTGASRIPEAEGENAPTTGGSRLHSEAQDRTGCGVGSSRHSSGCAQRSSTDTIIDDPPRQENGATELARVIADALTSSVSELRKDDEVRMTQFTIAFQEQFASFREDEEKRINRLEKAIAGLKPTPISIDPATNFWTVYKKVADEHDNDLLSKYAGDLDTSLLFAGLFSAVATTFIVQIIPSLQPNPVDLSNALLLRILENDASFGEANPLAPVMNVSPSVVSAQAILFASLSVTLFVAFIAVLGKQWILYYTRASTWGSIVDRGKERQIKFVGLQKWGLHFIMESLPVLLQLALLLFGVGLIVYLWDIDMPAAQVILAVIAIGCVFYSCIAVVATIWNDCPFQTPLSVLLPKVLPWTRGVTALPRVWLRRWSIALLSRIVRLAEEGHPLSPIGHWCKVVFGRGAIVDEVVEDVYDKHYTMTLSNPAFWRRNPLFTSPLPKDTAASAGFWLLENSTDFSAASAVAAVFSEFQWPSSSHSATALIRLRDTYAECFRAPKFDKSSRLKALQSAAAYYVLYRAWLIRSTSKTCEVEVEKPPSDLPPDLFLYKHGDKWGGDDLFEYLLRVRDRSEPVKSARFLSYIAPYWFCGDSDAAIRFRASRLPTLYELIAVLENNQALDPATFADCVLCVGAAMDFPLHPEDLIRVDKSKYSALTFKMVVEHIHGIILARSRRYRHAEKALDILLTLSKLPTLPLVDAPWIDGLLRRAAEGGMADDKFTLLLKLSARRAEVDATVDVGVDDYVLVQALEADPQLFGRTVTSAVPTPDHTLFTKLMRNIQSCVQGGKGWQEEAVYGGLIAIRSIRQLESSVFDGDTLQTLHDAMDGRNPFRVRKVAYDAALVTSDQWLKSSELRQKLENIGFFRQLLGVVVEIARSDYQRSFLMMLEILSEDEYWHPYLRKFMDLWLPLRHEGPEHSLRIFANVGELTPPGLDNINPPPLDEYLQKRVEDEWAMVPARPAHLLTADRLRPLKEVTEKFQELLFDDDHLAAALSSVDGVIPRLEQRRDNGYGGPGQDVRDIVDDLLEKLQTPPSPTSRRRSTYWFSN